MFRCEGGPEGEGTGSTQCSLTVLQWDQPRGVYATICTSRMLDFFNGDKGKKIGQHHAKLYCNILIHQGGKTILLEATLFLSL